MKILKIAILKDAFDEILSGEKTEEYQDFIPFWEEQLLVKDKEGVRFREYDAVEFKNGFEANVPTILIEMFHFYVIYSTSKNMSGCKINRISKNFNIP